MIEAVESERILQADEGITSQYIEEQIITRVEEYMNVLNSLGVMPPIVVMVNLLGVKGFNLATNTFIPAMHTHTNEIEQNDLLLPEIVFESYAESFQEYAGIIRPAFDSMWNAAGFPSSRNYNEQGEWVGQSR